MPCHTATAQRIAEVSAECLQLAASNCFCELSIFGDIYLSKYLIMLSDMEVLGCLDKQEDTYCLSCSFTAAPASAPPAMSVREGMAPSMSGHQSSVLKSLGVSSRAGWTFELSSQFQSTISDYGVIIPAEIDNVTLCAVPLKGNPTIC